MMAPPMTRIWFLISLLLAAIGTAGAAHARVVLVGVDGGSWNLIDPMMRAGELPNFSALAKRGVTADLETVEPVTSPVVWTSIATGRRPDAHGIMDFSATRLRIRVPSSFERLAARGVRVGLYDYLVTWPPALLPGGFVIPGWLRSDDSVSPPDAWAHSDLPPFTTDYDALRSSQEYLELARSEVALKAARWNELANRFDIEVGAVSFYAIDMTSHRFWHAAYPEDFDDEIPVSDPAERTAIPDAIRGIDRALGEVVANLGPKDSVLIASDHGFHANSGGTRSVWATRLGEALERADLSPERDGFTVVSAFGTVVLRIDPGDFAEREATRDRLVALLDSYSSADGDPLFLVNALDVAERPADQQRSLGNRFWQWAIRRVIDYKFKVRIDAHAHAVVVASPRSSTLDELWPKGSVRRLGEALPIDRVMNRHEFTGVHDPTGIFLAAGGPIAARPSRGVISVLDIAPLIFYLAGQPIPDDLPGRLPRDWIDPHALAENPPRVAPASDFPALPKGPEVEEISDPELTEKLRALGYLE